MKITNKENKVNKIYVQLKDIDFLIHSGLYIPKSICYSILEKIKPVDETNKNEYCVFSEPEEIDYFSKVDCIIDYKELRKHELGELSMLANEVEDKIVDLEEMYDCFTPEEQDINNSMLLQIERLAYKKRSIKELIDYKIGDREMRFPMVPDSDGFSLDSDQVYQVTQSLDPTILLLFRKDGKQLEETERIPEGIVRLGLSMAMSESFDEVNGLDFEVSKRISPDRKYLIIEFAYKRRELSSENLEEKNPRSILRRIFRV